MREPHRCDGGRVTGVRVRTRRRRRRRTARGLVIAADGRDRAGASASAWREQPRRPRRWAIGAYFERRRRRRRLGEMHVRARPLHRRRAGARRSRPTPASSCRTTRRRAAVRDAAAAILDAAARHDPCSRRASRGARRRRRTDRAGSDGRRRRRAGRAGLLLAGDAAGFIDPMTGDGIRLALRGARDWPPTSPTRVLRGTAATRRRRRACSPAAARGVRAAKWRFNRALRALVGAAARRAAPRVAARVWPRAVRGDHPLRGRRADASPRPLRGGVPIASASPSRRCVAVLLVMAGEAAALGAQRARAARARRRRAGRRRLPRRCSGRIRSAFVAMGVEGALTGPAPPTSLAVRARPVRPRQGAEDLGDRARSACAGRSACSCRPVRRWSRAGPYRVLRHPNYVAVVGEIAGMALIVWAPVDRAARAWSASARCCCAAHRRRGSRARETMSWPARCERRPLLRATAAALGPRIADAVGAGARRCVAVVGDRPADSGRDRRASHLGHSWVRPLGAAAAGRPAAATGSRPRPRCSRACTRRIAPAQRRDEARDLARWCSPPASASSSSAFSPSLLGYPPRPRRPGASRQRVRQPAGALGHRLVSGDRDRRLRLPAEPLRSAEHRVLPRLPDADALRLAARRRARRCGSACSSRWRRVLLGARSICPARARADGRGRGAAAVALLATYPFAFFFSAAYTESLFLLTIVGACYHFERDELWRGVAGGSWPA